jgi:hypothetical protein
MHGAAELVEALYYGYSGKALYLRIDLSGSFCEGHPEFEVRVTVDGARRARLHALAGGGGVHAVRFWKGDEEMLVPLVTGEHVQVAFSRIFEARLDYSLLGVGPREQIRLQVSIWARELPLQVIPQEGWLTLKLSEDLGSW